jgi:hypothetical protein
VFTTIPEIRPINPCLLYVQETILSNTSRTNWNSIWQLQWLGLQGLLWLDLDIKSSFDSQIWLAWLIFPEASIAANSDYIQRSVWRRGGCFNLSAAPRNVYPPHENGMAYVCRRVLSNAGRKTCHTWISQEVSQAYHKTRNRWRQHAGDTAYGEGMFWNIINLLALITLHYETRHGVSTVFRERREVERPVLVRGSEPDGVNMSRI